MGILRYCFWGQQKNTGRKGGLCALKGYYASVPVTEDGREGVVSGGWQAGSGVCTPSRGRPSAARAEESRRPFTTFRHRLGSGGYLTSGRR